MLVRWQCEMLVKFSEAIEEDEGLSNAPLHTD